MSVGEAAPSTEIWPVPSSLNNLAAQAQPDLAKLLRQAFWAHQEGDLAVAERLYAEVLRYCPDEFDALHMLGLLRYQRGHLTDALRLIAAALERNGEWADAWSNLGLVLDAQGRAADAMACYDKALALRPDHADVLNNRGIALNQLGRPAQALASFDAAIAAAPDHVHALYNRATTLMDLDRLEEAVAGFDAALAVQPNHADALSHRGNALLKLNRVEEAVATFAKALVPAPRDPQILHNHAGALRQLGRPGGALVSIEKALAIKPDFASWRVERALALLTLGDWHAGFVSYEERWNTEEFIPQRRDFAAPLWLGKESVAGKTVLLHAEQGFGDTLQFVRYAPLVARQGATVLLEVQPELQLLLSRTEGVARVLPRGEELPPFDLHCPLMSLPLACGTGVASVPAEVPYVRAPEELMAAWRDRLPTGKLRVGIAWAGRPTHKNDRNRSIALARLAPLLAAEVAFVSLQREPREQDTAALEAYRDLVCLGPELRTFADTAAVVSLLDLVISVDTALVHLAGALGKPAWIMLPAGPDWRWLLKRDDTPWYPTARLFRQPRLGDWESVVERVRRELDRFASVGQSEQDTDALGRGRMAAEEALGALPG
jgi:tetratricopeptide (TPR) repeat protein